MLGAIGRRAATAAMTAGRVRPQLLRAAGACPPPSWGARVGAGWRGMADDAKATATASGGEDAPPPPPVNEDSWTAEMLKDKGEDVEPSEWMNKHMFTLDSEDPFGTPTEEVKELGDRIARLDLVEFAMLCKYIQRRLGISDAEMSTMMMSTGGGGGGGMAAGGGAGDAGAEAAAAEEEEKTAFNVKLTGFDAKSKIKVIKEVRGITGLGLKEAKQAVESVPTVIKADVSKEEAEEIMEKIKAVGGELEMD